MRRLIFTLIFTALFSGAFANHHKASLGTDTLLLHQLVDSLNQQIKRYGLSREEIQVKENGEVKIKSLKFGQQFNFNFFELGNDTIMTNHGNMESRFGIRTRMCDPGSHAPRHAIEFTTPNGKTMAYLFFTCFKDLDLKLVQELILSIRKQCVEIRDYLK